MRVGFGLVAMAGCAPDGTMIVAADDDALYKIGVPLRVVSWNIETVGAPGSLEYDAALDVLARLDADVVAIQEIASLSDQADLVTFAADAGYPEVEIGWPVSFGSDHNAILSRHPFNVNLALDAPTLSGDPLADDLTRSFVYVEVQTPGAPLTVVTNHWKSSGGDDDEYRRTIESKRAVQGISHLDPNQDAIVVFGDVNEEPDQLPLFPATFFTKPAGLPGSFYVGQDLFDEMVQVGLDNDPFAPLTDFGLTLLPATQRDGSNVTTRGGSNLDHAFVSSGLRVDGLEIFDDNDEHLASSLHLTTNPIAAGTVDDASDHHPLVVEVRVRP